MITLEVRINGVLVARAGNSKMSVLSAIIMAAGKLGPDSAGTDHDPRDESIDLRVGGMTAPIDGQPQEHLDWLVREVTVGDEISVSITESLSADDPQAVRSFGTKEFQERQAFEHARTTYLRLRKKYESET